MVVRPVLASLSINSTFVANGTIVFSFCRPSRGPTSTILTRLSKEGCCWPGASVAVAKGLRHLGELLRREVRAIGRTHFILSGWP